MARLSAGPSPVIRRVNTAPGSAWGVWGGGGVGGSGGGDHPAPILLLLELSRSNFGLTGCDVHPVTSLWRTVQSVSMLGNIRFTLLSISEPLRRLFSELSLKPIARDELKALHKTDDKLGQVEVKN